MTRRDQQLVKALLDEAHDLDGKQTSETLLHAGMNLRLPEKDKATLAEFEAALAITDARGWLTGVKSQFAGKRWKINDAGEAARLEMR
jgi:hypothetical protein